MKTHHAPHDPPPLVPVPTLEDLADRPELARTLPRAVLMDLSFRALRAQAAAHIALAALPPESPAAALTQEDEPLDVTEAARRLGISVRTLYRGAHTTYATLCVPTGTRNLRFSSRAIAAYATRRPEIQRR